MCLKHWTQCALTSALRYKKNQYLFNAASFQTLVGAQESLKARLESFEKDVRVEVVSERGEAEAENGDGRRQSRGEYVAPDERDA